MPSPTAAPEIMQRMAQLRLNVLNKVVTLDELKEGIRLLRQHRMSAAQASAKSKAKKPVAVTGADAAKLLDELF